MRPYREYVKEEAVVDFISSLAEFESALMITLITYVSGAAMRHT